MSNVERTGKGFRFTPSISFDGVAIIVGLILAAVWFGQLKQKVDATADTVARHSEELKTLNETTARIAAHVEERKRNQP